MTTLIDKYGKQWKLVPEQPFISMLVDGSNAYKD